MSDFSNRRAAGRASALCVGLFALAGTAGTVEAAPYQKLVIGTCPGSGHTCEQLAQTVPANRRIEVTSVSCMIQVAQNAQIRYAALGKGSDVIFDYFVPTRTSNEAVGARYSFNAQTLLFAGPGDLLHVSVGSTGDVMQFVCKLAGTIAVLQ